MLHDAGWMGSLHLASSPEEFSRGCIFRRRCLAMIHCLQYQMCQSLNDYSVSLMRNSHQISNPKLLHKMRNVVWIDANKIPRKYMMTSSNGTFPASLASCEENPPVTDGFPSQRPVTQNFNIFFDLYLNKRSSKQWRRRWFETLSHYDVTVMKYEELAKCSTAVKRVPNDPLGWFWVCAQPMRDGVTKLRRLTLFWAQVWNQPWYHCLERNIPHCLWTRKIGCPNGCQ